MSLLNKTTTDENERGSLITQEDADNKSAEERREYQKKHRARHLDNWKEQKAIIDGLSGDELDLYISEAKDNRTVSDQRVGQHVLKVNPYELAIIKRAMEIKGVRSSRELFINYCSDVVEGKD